MSADFIDVRSIPVMTMAMGVIVHVAISCVGFSCEVAANKEREAKSRNHQSRPYAQPWVESFREDPLRCVKRDDAQRIYRNRMRRGNDRAEQHRMAGLAVRPHQIGGDKSLAMPGFERMKST